MITIMLVIMGIILGSIITLIGLKLYDFIIQREFDYKPIIDYDLELHCFTFKINTKGSVNGIYCIRDSNLINALYCLDLIHINTIALKRLREMYGDETNDKESCLGIVDGYLELMLTIGVDDVY